jgi:hypothetical protein
MDKLDHLFEDTATVMGKSVDEKVEYLRKDFFLEYPKASEIVQKLDDLISYPQVSRMPCYLIIAEPNYGKTGLVNHFCKNHPPSDNLPGEHIKFPVLMIQAPVVPDEKRLYQTILRKLKCPFNNNTPPSMLETQVMEVLGRIQPKIFIIDEIQNLIAGTSVKQRVLMNVIKNMHNELKIPLVGVGTKKALIAIKVDDQLESRFTPLDLPKWKYGDDFLDFLESFEHAMPLEKASNLCHKPTSKMIYDLSGGILGRIAGIIREATTYCLRNGLKNITQKILQKI